MTATDQVAGGCVVVVLDVVVVVLVVLVVVAGSGGVDVARVDPGDSVVGTGLSVLEQLETATISATVIANQDLPTKNQCTTDHE
jgi:hypothetical protein